VEQAFKACIEARHLDRALAPEVRKYAAEVRSAIDTRSATDASTMEHRRFTAAIEAEMIRGFSP
jgi:hypothetical protein